jgi:hypothetical protein
MAEAVVAQVRMARTHASDSPATSVTVEPAPQLDDAPDESREDESRRLHHHSDDHEHDPTGEHCVHHHSVGPTATLPPVAAIGLMLELTRDGFPTVPDDRTRPVTPEPPRA